MIRLHRLHSRLRSHELSPAVGSVPILQRVSPIITIIALSHRLAAAAILRAAAGWMKAGAQTTVASTRAVINIFITRPLICAAAFADTDAVSLALSRKVDRAKVVLFPDS